MDIIPPIEIDVSEHPIIVNAIQDDTLQIKSNIEVNSNKDSDIIQSENTNL